MSHYLKITLPCSASLHEILIAELSHLNYDSFQEIDEELQAFVKEEFFDETNLNSIVEKYGITADIKVEKLEDINWNEQWEKNFDPVYIDDMVHIRATFHEPQASYKYDIIINPKMAFGTGHHETTHLMIAEQLTINHKGKCVLDVGTGTGVLTIMAYKLGASALTATDIDDWCIDNSRENLEMNQVKNFKILQGTIDKLTLPEQYDIIYANINKNVLMAEIPYYSSLIKDNGLLVLSGFYSKDIDDLKEKAAKNKLSFLHAKTRNNWALIRLSKSKL